MALDFSGQNLRGRNFKGRKDLAGANFSYADIRGANFSNANLTGANFSHVKAGLQRRWTIFLVLVSWLLSGLSGLLWVANGLLVSRIFDTSSLEFQIGGWAALIVLIAFFFVTICQGVAAGLGVLAVGLAVVFAVAIAGVIIGPGAGVIIGAGAGVIFGGGAGAGAGAGDIAGAGAVGIG